MRLRMIRNWAAFLFLFPAALAAQALKPLPATPGPEDYYQSALQAYLAGDLDHAVLYDSKALQADPRDKKAQALLSILVSEQDKVTKSVIWIGGKPSLEADVHPAAPVTVVKEVHVRPRANPADARKLAELEARIQTVAFLMQRDSFNQYRELSGNQIRMSRELAGISQKIKDAGIGFQYANVLFLVILFIALLALWNSWEARRVLEKRHREEGTPKGSHHSENVVRLRRR